MLGAFFSFIFLFCFFLLVLLFVLSPLFKNLELLFCSGQGEGGNLSRAWWFVCLLVSLYVMLVHFSASFFVCLLARSLAHFSLTGCLAD